MEQASQETDTATAESDVPTFVEEIAPSFAPIPSQMFSGFDGSLSGSNYAVWIGCGASVLMVAALVFAMSSRPPEPATLVFVTRPPDVSISLDGKPVRGRSPFKLERLNPAIDHTIEVRKPGFIPQVHHVALATGEVKRLPPVALEPLSIDRGLALSNATPAQGIAVDEIPSSQPVQLPPARITAPRHQAQPNAPN